MKKKKKEGNTSFRSIFGASVFLPRVEVNFEAPVYPSNKQDRKGQDSTKRSLNRQIVRKEEKGIVHLKILKLDNSIMKIHKSIRTKRHEKGRRFIFEQNSIVWRGLNSANFVAQFFEAARKRSLAFRAIISLNRRSKDNGPRRSLSSIFFHAGGILVTR